MSQFCYQADQTRSISSIALHVGEEAQPILWKGVRPDDNVHAVFFHQEHVLMFADETATAQSAHNAYRVLQLTGRSPGTGKYRAVEVPRTGNLKTLGELQFDVRETYSQGVDLTYSGKFLYWHGATPKSVMSAGRLLFPATSGSVGHQIALMQREKNEGPLPEGLYTFSTQVNPRQNSVEAANRRGDLAVSNAEEGIQFLRIGGNGPVDTRWGTFRVRLTPVSGNMFGRDGFYIHNSHKGFSSGCIEVGQSADGDALFALLLAYSGEHSRKPKLTLRVKYSYPEQITLGNTYTP